MSSKTSRCVTDLLMTKTPSSHRCYSFMSSPTHLCNRQPSSLTLSGKGNKRIGSLLQSDKVTCEHVSFCLIHVPLGLNMINEAHENTFFLIKLPHSDRLKPGLKSPVLPLCETNKRVFKSSPHLRLAGPAGRCTKPRQEKWEI